MDAVTRFPVAEIFGPTLQGEGRDIGRMCHFIRFGGCDYRCSWCDSMHAVDPEKVKQLPKLTAEQIVYELDRLKPVDYVVFTGGNPAMYDLSELARALHLKGISIAVETQGTIFNSWLHFANVVTISPKPPSSGMPDTTGDRLPRFLREFNFSQEKLVLKVVVFEDADLEYAAKVHQTFPQIEFFLSGGTEIGNTQPRFLLDRVKWIHNEIQRPQYRDVFKDVRVLPQMHVLLWGDELGR